ncbi:hypothetical protein [Polyangium sp. 15x6]|uniref:hypothetical protein n=1 Tax=Polyangium sp. 15x6 TaxID=3042687 RepID=UPI002499C701|nr:hypothetical protein [Polyangium sp. 15x6]MDI3292201.1 hypothetical protein [Polyangium sp. 15x6]
MKLTIKTDSGEMMGTIETPYFRPHDGEAKLPGGAGMQLWRMIHERVGDGSSARLLNYSFTIETDVVRLESCFITRADTSGNDPMDLRYRKATPL